MNIAGVNFSLEQDLLFLRKNGANRFADVSIDEVSQLLLRKKTYKQNESYNAFKAEVKKLKMAKLPFRIIEILNTRWKGAEDPLPHQLRRKYPDQNKSFDPQERKELKKTLRDQLLAEAKNNEKTLRLVEQINFLHGTNSALLPMIHESLEMIPTGRLLELGKAPMGGEIGLGGIKANGINQHSLSADTIRDIKKCWEYASKTSNSFDPNVYSDPEQLFLITLNEINEISPSDDDWDKHIVKLLRLKQWNPEGFIELCEKYRKEIEACKQNTKDKFLTRNELRVQKAINYDSQTLQAARKEDTIPEFLPTEFGVIVISTWEQEINGQNQITKFLNEGFNCIVCDSTGGWQCLMLKLLAKEMFHNLEKKAQTSKKDIFRMMYTDYVERIKEICFGDKTKEFTDDDYSLIFQKLVVEKMEALIKSKMMFCQNRYDRLIKLFDSQPIVHFSKEDQEMIEKPFGILFASTKSKALQLHEGEEFNFHKAKLGEDIDLAFVSSENKGQMCRWIKDHGLEGKVTVLDYAILGSLENIPLYHAPDQLQHSSSLFKEEDAKKINHLLNESVFPLYRAPYADGTSRFWHGVSHSVRTALFVQVLMEMTHEKGMELKQNKMGLLLAMALHDVARENDGKDLWDFQSGQMAKKILQSVLGLSEEESSFFATCIADKDKEAVSLEQRIIHDGDCLEIMRTLNDPSDFQVNELRMKEFLDVEEMRELVKDAQLLIELTDKEPIKGFLENSKNSYQALIQIIFQAYQVHGKFEFFVKHIYPLRHVLTNASEYQLTTEVEESLKTLAK